MLEKTDLNSISELELKNPITEWLPKQKRAFNSILTGFKLAKRNNEPIRFLTLTTSDLQRQNIAYDPKHLNESIRKLKQRIQRLTPYKLKKMGYISLNKLRYYYPNKPIGEYVNYKYFRIRTNEGNGVAHILYKGDYIPYDWIVDSWRDIHNSWNVDIRLIKNKLKFYSRYLVSQYITNQKTAYDRSSQSWDWIIRAYRREWLYFIKLCHQRYFYDSEVRRFYRKNPRYNEDQLTLFQSADPPPPISERLDPRGVQVDIFEEWGDYIYRLVNIRVDSRYDFPKAYLTRIQHFFICENRTLDEFPQDLNS